MESVTPPEPAHDRLRRAFDLAARQPADAGVSATAAGLQRICRAAVAELPLSGAAVHLVPDGRQDVIAAASAPSARAVAELAFALGEGPSRDAFTNRRPVLAGDLAARLDRWPGFVSQALDLGIEGVYAFPLQLGATCLGVLDLYAEHSGATLNGLLPTALSFAQAAVLTLLDAVEGEAVIEDDKTADLGEAGRGLYEAFDHRPEIHQAQGMVMVDLAVPLTQALLRMRARAFGTGTTLLELSRRIIDGEEDPRTWDADLPPKGHEDGPPGLRSDTGGTS